MNIWPTMMIDVDLLDEMEENPNQMTDDEFSALVEEVAEHGWLAPVQAVGPTPEGRYGMFGGHHRKRAAIVLGMPQVPCTVVEPEAFDEDFRKIQLVKQNVLHGSLNPEKFTKLFNELAKKYDAQMLQRMMAFTKADAFNRVYNDARNALPPGMADKLDDMRDELKTVDDLSLALNRLFTEYGDTLDCNFMFFSFGGRSHIMVQLRQPGAWDRVRKFANWCNENKLPVDQELMRRMDWSMPNAETELTASIYGREDVQSVQTPPAADGVLEDVEVV